MNGHIRYFLIPLGVAYDTDILKVIKVVKEAVEKSGFKLSALKRHSCILKIRMG